MKQEPRATLRLALKEELLAYELESVIDVIDETYTSLRWLELAEAHTGSLPYGDSEFAYDEFLRIPKVEIGTPNIIEFYGLYDIIKQTILYLGGIGGVVGIGSKSVTWALDAKNKWLEGRIKAIELKEKQDPLRQELEMKKLEADVRKAELENEKLLHELEEIKKGRKRIEPILDKTKRLYSEGKASEKVLAYKKKRQESITDKLNYHLIDNVVIIWELIPD